MHFARENYSNIYSNNTQALKFY